MHFADKIKKEELTGNSITFKNQLKDSKQFLLRLLKVIKELDQVFRFSVFGKKRFFLYIAVLQEIRALEYC